MSLTMMLVAFVTLMGVTTGQDDMTTDNYRSIQAELADIRLQMAADRRVAEKMELQMAADRRGAVEMELQMAADRRGAEEMELQMAADRLQAEETKLALTTTIDELRKEIASISSSDVRHDEDPVQVAFSVVSVHSFAGDPGTNIPFETVYTNVGDGWSSATNEFVTPVDGLYVFTASVTSDLKPGVYASCDIVKTAQDGYWSVVASMIDRASTSDQQFMSSSSNSVIIPLIQGETVHVKLSDGAIWSASSYGRYSSFSGFLLFT